MRTRGAKSEKTAETGGAARARWLAALLFWAALSLPFVKHLGRGGGLPAVNADHVVAYPVDVAILFALAWVFLSDLKEAGKTRRGGAALGRALADLFKPDLISWAIAAAAVAAFLSLYHAPMPESALSALVDVARLYAAYVLFRRLAAAGPRPVLVGLLAAAAAHGALCLVEFSAQNNFGLWEKPGWGAFVFAGVRPAAARLLMTRGGGTFEPNVTSQFLQMALPFAAVYFVASPGARRRALYLGLFILTAAAMFVTFSRGGWFGAALALALVVVFMWVKKSSVGAPTWALATLTAAGVVLLLPAVGVVLARGVQGDQLSAAYRLADWRTAFAMIRDHPLLGVGRGNYLELARLHNPWSLEYPVHNVYLLSWAETGLVGLGALVALLVGAFRAAGRTLRRSAGYDAAFGLAALAAFAGIAVRMFVSMSFVHPFVSLTFVALAAGAAALSAGPPSRE